ncbi:MAG: alpha/beta hydrolase domain-containing protein [Pseudomonadota bacterium]
MSQLIRLDIAERGPFADGHPFGAAGPYERLVGRAHLAIDPSHPAQAGITDLAYAPRNADGWVAFATDICILAPLDATHGNRRLFFGYGNRGNKRELQFFNDAPASNDPRSLRDAGNGFLMRRGYTVIWAAWQGDLLPGNNRMLLDTPIARDREQDITGLVRTEFIANRDGIVSFPLSSQISVESYPTASLDPKDATLTRRRYPHDKREPVAASRWSFARVDQGTGLDGQGAQRAVVPSDTHIYLDDGFESGFIYELVYRAKHPRVHGLGHVAVRDVVSFLRYAEHDANGAPNPIGPIDKAYAWGRSQTGRCIRDFVHAGYNEDAAGRRVFDGVLPHVAGAGLMWMNHRFASVNSPAGQEYEDHFNIADHFPFSYAESTDHITGRTDAILKRPETDPLVIHTQTSTEYWQRRGSLVHTDTMGNDLPQPDNVRVYLWSSSQHFADPNAAAPESGFLQHLGNTVQTSMLFRAMLDAMDRWASEGVAPPESRIPKVSDGTLVDAETWRAGFPDIPGVATPKGPSDLCRLDFGQDVADGVLHEPPRVLDSRYTVLVPAVDNDGNERAGVRVPTIAAPLGTFAGWNLRPRHGGFGAMFEFSGCYLPFCDTVEEREQTRDPRPAILERYATIAAYHDALRVAAVQLVEDGLMLEEDIERVLERAEDWGRPLHVCRLRAHHE